MASCAVRCQQGVLPLSRLIFLRTAGLVALRRMGTVNSHRVGTSCLCQLPTAEAMIPSFSPDVAAGDMKKVTLDVAC